MQQINAYSIRDIKADAYMHPFYAPTHALALRMFGDVANDPKSSVGQHPEDFTLHCVGKFCQSSGQMLPLDAPQFLGNATEYVKV